MTKPDVKLRGPITEAGNPTSILNGMYICLIWPCAPVENIQIRGRSEWVSRGGGRSVAKSFSGKHSAHFLLDVMFHF